MGIGGSKSVERMVLFPAPKSSYDYDLQNLVHYTDENGKKWPGLYVSATREPPTATILYLHANACDIGIIEHELAELAIRTGARIYAPEYPGYGIFDSDSTTAAGIDEAALNGIRFLKEIVGVHESDIAVFGRSIGSGPAAKLALVMEGLGTPCGGLILQTPYTGIHDLVDEYAPVGKMLIGDLWNSEDVVTSIDVPLLVIHGERDEVIPVSHGKTIYEKAITKRKIGHFPTQARHNDWEFKEDVVFPTSSFLSTHIRDPRRKSRLGA